MADDVSVNGAEPQSIQPLPESGWQRLWHLIGLPERTPDQHSELADLHAKAKAYAEAFVADPDGAFTHVLSALDMTTRALRGIATVVPAAAPVASAVNMIDVALGRAKAAFIAPPSPPDLPEPPVVNAPAADPVAQAANGKTKTSPAAAAAAAAQA